MQRDRLLITADAVVTMDSQRRLHTPGYLRISDQHITEVGGGAPQQLPGEVYQHLDGGLVLPGLVNAHHHLASTLLQGVQPDSTIDLTNDHQDVRQRLGMATDRAACRAGALLGYLQLVTAGVTATADSQAPYRDLAKLDGSLEAAHEAGLRVRFTTAFTDRTELVPSAQQLSIDEALAELERVRGIYEYGRVTVDPEALSLPRASDGLIRALHRERGRLMAMHLTYSRRFDAWAREELGTSTVAHLDRLGVLDGLLAAHPIHLDDDEVERLGSNGVTAAYCPVSNAHLGLAVADVPRLARAGVVVGLGLDHPNGSHDAFQNTKAGLLAQRARAESPDAWRPDDALAAATIDAAHALGWGDQIGSLEAGKLADLVVLDGRRAELQPPGGLIEPVVTGATAASVRHVMIGGHWEVVDGRPQRLDRQAIVDEAATAQRRVLVQAGLDPTPRQAQRQLDDG